MEDSSAVALPFSPNLNRKPRLHDRLREVVLRRDSKVTLSNFQVDSSATGMIHSEQMCDVGPIALDDSGPTLKVTNKSTLQIQDAMVLRRKGLKLEACYLSGFEPQTSRSLDFRDVEGTVQVERFPEWENNPECPFAKATSEPGNVSLREFGRLATVGLKLRDGEYRLVGWTDQPVAPGAIRPAPAVENRRTMILAHLKRANWGATTTDSKLQLDFDEKMRESLDILPEENPTYRDDTTPNAAARAEVPDPTNA